MLPTLQYYSKVRNIIQIVKVICILVQYSPFVLPFYFFIVILPVESNRTIRKPYQTDEIEKSKTKNDKQKQLQGVLHLIIYSNRQSADGSYRRACPRPQFQRNPPVGKRRSVLQHHQQRAAGQGWIHLAIHPRRHEPIRRLSVSELLEVQQQCEAEKLLLDFAAHQRQHPRTDLGIHPEQYPVLLRSGGSPLF